MRFSLIAGITLAALLAVSTASANKMGLAGYTGKPNPVDLGGASCTKCHKTISAKPSSVVLMGPATLTAGQVAQYSLVVTTTQPKAACGVAATDGVVLAPVSAGLQETFDEILPANGATATSGGKGTFVFTVKAPTTGTAIKLWASGMASNGDGNTGGDYADQTTMNITITGGSTATDAGTDAGSSGTISDGGSSGSSGASSSGSSGASSSSSSSGSSGSTSGGEEDAGSTASSSGDTLPNDEAGGCSVSGNDGYGSALFLGAISMIPLLARRRRAKK